MIPPGGTYLELQAQAVLKQVTSQFPYEAPEGQPSLQTEGAHLTKILCRTLQQRVNGTGARILSFDLVDLSYAPEIAQAMLVRQQAAALVDARKLIVKAAVEMTTSAVKSLEARMEGRKLPNDVKDRICTNLLTVVCSSETVTPTLGVGS
jgi:membrane protease subunit (stomatin/prohibitin family)